MGGRGIAATALVVLGATVVAAPAGAKPEPIRVTYSAPRRCPDEAAFLRALRQRTASFQLARGAEPARVFVATIAVDAGAVTGRLEIRGPGAEMSLRKVPGKTCDEVVEALALMTALAVDPGALAASPAAASAPAPAPGPTPPARPARPATAQPAGASGSSAAASASSASTSTAITTERRPSPSVPPAPEPRPQPPSEPVADAVSALATPIEATAAGWRWSMGAHGAATSGVSPSLGLGGVVFVEAAPPGRSLWAPVFRAGLSFSQSDVTLSTGSAADFRWLTGVVEGCPARLLTAEARLGLYPCLALQIGALRGRGSQLDEPRSATSLWTDVGPLLRLRVAVSARLFLEAQAALVVPLRRVTFDVQEAGPASPATTLFAVPALGTRAGIGVAYGFE